MLRSKNDYVKRFMPRELKLIPSLNHQNIIKFYQVFILGLIFIFFLLI